MTEPTISYHEYLIQSLKDPEEAAGYLTASFEDEDPRVFLLALRNVAEAYGGMEKLSKAAGLNRENLYRMLSEKGNPEFYSLNSLLDVLDLKIVIEAKKRKTPGKRKTKRKRKTALASKA